MTSHNHNNLRALVTFFLWSMTLCAAFVATSPACLQDESMPSEISIPFDGSIPSYSRDESSIIITGDLGTPIVGDELGRDDIRLPFHGHNLLPAETFLQAQAAYPAAITPDEYGSLIFKPWLLPAGFTYVYEDIPFYQPLGGGRTLPSTFHMNAVWYRLGDGSLADVGQGSGVLAGYGPNWRRGSTPQDLDGLAAAVMTGYLVDADSQFSSQITTTTPSFGYTKADPIAGTYNGTTQYLTQQVSINQFATSRVRFTKLQHQLGTRGTSWSEEVQTVNTPSHAATLEAIQMMALDESSPFLLLVGDPDWPQDSPIVLRSWGVR
jgi:hypothetical protein